MPRDPTEQRSDPRPPLPAPVPEDEIAPDDGSEGNLDLDDHDGINNQHLEVR